MSRSASRAALLAALLVLAACASTPEKQAKLQGDQVLTTVRDLAAACERRDIDAFMDRVSLSYPDRDALRRSLEQTFAAYQTIRLKVQYTRMLIMVEYQKNIKVVFTWEGEWRSTGGKIVQDGARVTLVLDPGVFKLLGIEGKNPFVPSEAPLPVKQ